MKVNLKPVLDTSAEITSEGYIKICNHNEFGSDDKVSVTFDQFVQIQKWIEQHQEAIQLAWRGGVDDDKG